MLNENSSDKLPLALAGGRFERQRPALAELAEKNQLPDWLKLEQG